MLKTVAFTLFKKKEYIFGKSKQCGFSLTVDKDFQGQWTLYANLANGTTYYAVFTINVQDEKALKPSHVRFKIKTTFY